MAYEIDFIGVSKEETVKDADAICKPYPLSRTVSKSRTPCFRQFNNPGTFKMDVW